MRRRASNDGRERDVRDCQAGQRTVDRLNRLISDLLDVARLDRGVLNLDVQPINLAEVARDVASALAAKRSKMRGKISGAMPGPSSRTSRTPQSLLEDSCLLLVPRQQSVSGLDGILLAAYIPITAY